MSTCVLSDRSWNGTLYDCLKCYNTTTYNYMYTKCHARNVPTTAPAIPIRQAWVIFLIVSGLIITFLVISKLYKKLSHGRYTGSSIPESEVIFSEVRAVPLPADNSHEDSSSTLSHIPHRAKWFCKRACSLQRNGKPFAFSSITNDSSPRSYGSMLSSPSSDKGLTRKCESNSIMENVTTISSDMPVRRTEHVATDQNILNGPWQIKKHIGYSGGYVVFPSFNVCLNFPNGAIATAGGMNIFGLIHSDIPLLRESFKLMDNDIIVAPVPELYTDCLDIFSDHVSILIPHCLELNSNLINVQWFEHTKSDPSGIKLQDVRKLACFADRTENMDIFYVDQKDGYIRVYTKHFSGILCTACQREVRCDMQATLLSKFGEMDGSLSLSLKMIIGGPLMKLEGFWKQTVAKAESRGFTVIETGEVDLFREQNDTSVLQVKLELCGESFVKWQHIKRQGTDELIYHIIQTKSLSEMKKCGNEHEMCSNIQWYLKPVNNEIHRGNVTLYIDITNVVHRTQEEIANVRTTINAEIPIPSSGAQEDDAGAPSTTVKAAVYLLLDAFDSGKFKKLVRFLGFSEKAIHMNEFSEEEKKDYWYNTMMDIAKTKGRHSFPDVLCSALQTMKEPIASEVRSQFQEIPSYDGQYLGSVEHNENLLPSHFN